MSKSVIMSVIGMSTLVIGAMLPMNGFLESANARPPRNDGFSERSLNGSYASAGRADGFASRSVGVTTFDGRGRVARVVTINASDGEGGRRLIEVVSVGTYTVDRDGLGVITFINEGLNNTEVNFDFVIAESSRGGSRGGLQANVINGVQREAGTTASLIEEVWTRREGL